MGGLISDLLPLLHIHRGPPRSQTEATSTEATEITAQYGAGGADGDVTSHTSIGVKDEDTGVIEWWDKEKWCLNFAGGVIRNLYEQSLFNVLWFETTIDDKTAGKRITIKRSEKNMRLKMAGLVMFVSKGFIPDQLPLLGLGKSNIPDNLWSIADHALHLMFVWFTAWLCDKFLADGSFPPQVARLLRTVLTADYRMAEYAYQYLSSHLGNLIGEKYDSLAEEFSVYVANAVADVMVKVKILRNEIITYTTDVFYKQCPS